MTLLLLAALFWIAWHVGLAGTGLRGQVVTRLGETGFMILFSVVSVASIILLVMAYNAAPYLGLWVTPRWVRWLLALVMLPALILFVGSVTRPNPTAAGQKPGPPIGITRITRHPMLWSFALWGIVHVVGNGDLASLIFFGAFALTSLAGMPSIDAKLARRDPEGWARLAAGSAIIPFTAGRVDWAEVGARPLILGVVLWVGLLAVHPIAFGVPAVW